MARRRDPEIDRRVLRVTREMLDSGPASEVTVDAVAHRAGVSRPTVYRRWPTRAALLFAAETHASVSEPFPDLGSIRADLIAAVTHLAATMASSDRAVVGDQFAAMVADETFARRVWDERWIPDREIVHEVWQRGVERGELDSAVDGRRVIDELVAVCMFRVLFGHEALMNADVERIVDRALGGVRPSGWTPGDAPVGDQP